MENIKYYDNKETHGIIYDWNKIFKEYNKLKPPKEFYSPVKSPVNSAKFFILMSERSSGKTTAWLLVGMIMNKLYGTTIEYIRQSVDMIKSTSLELFRVIIEYDNGRYIEQLTDGEYNSIYIFWRQAYYCRVDEKGKIISKSEKPFLTLLSIDNSANYKSSYNAPKGDLIIFDEFLNRNGYRPNEFLNFMDLLSTIIRKRKSPIVVMLANAVDYTSPYFKEFEISKEIKTLKTGDNKIIKTEKGTIIYAEIIGVKQTELKKEINRLFFGFNNSNLTSITGGINTWAFDSVPHYLQNENDIIITKNIRLDCNDCYIALDLIQTEHNGIIVFAHPSTKKYDDTLILTNGNIDNSNKFFGFGHGKIFDIIWRLYKQNKFFYDTNETGAIVKNYVRTALQLKR